MSRPAIVATILLVALGGRQPVFAEEATSEPRCVCGSSTGADVLNAGHPIFSESANASANERDSRIDGHVFDAIEAELERRGVQPLSEAEEDAPPSAVGGVKIGQPRTVTGGKRGSS